MHRDTSELEDKEKECKIMSAADFFGKGYREDLDEKELEEYNKKRNREIEEKFKRFEVETPVSNNKKKKESHGKPTPKNPKKPVKRRKSILKKQGSQSHTKNHVNFSPEVIENVAKMEKVRQQEDEESDPEAKKKKKEKKKKIQEEAKKPVSLFRQKMMQGSGGDVDQFF